MLPFKFNLRRYVKAYAFCLLFLVAAVSEGLVGGCTSRVQFS
jgi:hypothetical protein